MRGYAPLVVMVLLHLLSLSQSADFLLRPNTPVCTALVSSFDPIKVEVTVPTIGSKIKGEHVALTLFDLKTSTVVKQQKLEDGLLFRHNYYLEHYHIHNLCFQFVTERQSSDQNVLFVSFWAEEDFQDIRAPSKIPQELLGDENLKSIYETGQRMGSFIRMSAERQKKQRQVEDRLVDLSSHKTKRITTITVIQCIVIILSGVYQIFSLRKFLIDRNLY